VAIPPQTLNISAQGLGMACLWHPTAEVRTCMRRNAVVPTTRKKYLRPQTSGRFPDSSAARVSKLGAALGVHPVMARRIAANFAKVPELLREANADRASACAMRCARGRQHNRRAARASAHVRHYARRSV